MTKIGKKFSEESILTNLYPVQTYAIATSTVNPAAVVLAALAVIADSIENSAETHRTVLSLSFIASKSIYEPPLLALGNEYILWNGNHSRCITSGPRTVSPDNSDRDDELTVSQPTYRNRRATRCPLHAWNQTRRALFQSSYGVYLFHMQLPVDELQTEMNAETNCTRRKEKLRALERPRLGTYVFHFLCYLY
jgi:hypothetical protein